MKQRKNSQFSGVSAVKKGTYSWEEASLKFRQTEGHLMAILVR